MNADHDSKSQSATDPKTTRGRYGPLRVVAPWAAMLGGLAISISRLSRLSSSESDLGLFIGGVILFFVGLASLFAFRWMAKRRI